MIDQPAVVAGNEEKEAPRFERLWGYELFRDHRSGANCSGVIVRTPLPLLIVRLSLVVVVGGLAGWFMRSPLYDKSLWPQWGPWAVFFGVILSALLVIAIDIWVPRKRIETVSAVYFGLLVGLALGYAVSLALFPLLENSPFREGIQTLVTVTLCYICISLLLQTQDDFRFLIPYVEFSREVKGLVPYVLDTSAIIDGRILDLVQTGAFDNPLIMPRFVLDELQAIADTSERLKRARGRRGLDVLNKLQASRQEDFQIIDRETPEMEGQSVDMKLVLLAKQLNGKIVTGDFNLNKIAKLHDVEVVNLNEIANALKPLFLPGEQFVVEVVKGGESPDQGVGYLEDGTMVVVEQGRRHIGETVRIAVTSVLQTNAGRMIFGRYDTTVDPRGESSLAESGSANGNQ